MRRPLRLILLFGIFTLTVNLYESNPTKLLSAAQNSAPRLPDAPPPGNPTPGNPEEVRPPRPTFPPDFLDNPRDHKRSPKKIDPAQAQKDAEALTALAKKVQDEVDQLSKNILSKDLNEDLKHLEKLAKHLREEITP